MGSAAKLDTAGTLNVTDKSLALASLQAVWKQQTLRLLAPVRIGFADGVSLDRLRLGLRQAVIDVAHGRTVVPAELAAGLAGEIRLRAAAQGPVLSERERQVLQAFARGLSVPQVAAELFIGVSTVKTHTQRLYEKLGVSDRAAAVAVAMRQGLVE
ncbi:MAG: response regulator transcription factor [Rhodospirillales bacterium]|nr:response regulator transcription factor [Rhodospirillales bacterium]